MRPLTTFLILPTALLGAPAAPAQDRPPEHVVAEAQANQSADQVDAVIRCRGIADGARRLQCFDAAVATLAEATARHDIVVVDRNEVRETRRRLFGFALPNIRLFGGGDRDEQDEADEVRELNGTVARATNGRGRRWVVTLEDGSIWTQTDDRPLAIWPERGTSVVIRRGMLGNFMMEVDGQPGIRVRRTG